jgi:hypothetical protein
VVVEAGVVALAGDWRESLEVERERAGENAAYRRDADRYEREREAYRDRDKVTAGEVPAPLRALSELERIEPGERDPIPPVEGEEKDVVSSADGTHNTSEGVFSGGGYGPAPATPDRTGQEWEMEHEQAEESGETGDSGAGESVQEERGRGSWVPSASYMRMVSHDQGWAA